MKTIRQIGLFLLFAFIYLGSIYGYRAFQTEESPPRAAVEADISITAEIFQCPRCNVIFLNIELLRADYTGLIGDTELTPSIDSFFENSLIFKDMTAPAGETFLSNTAVLTGMHPFRFKISGIISTLFNGIILLHETIVTISDFSKGLTP